MDSFVRSKRSCCIVGCTSSEAKNPELHFYRFPGKSYEVERKKRWIAAVKRITADGKPWIPSAEARVCSLHFVGGKKSENMHDLAYIPSIFPSIYKRKAPDEQRAERLKRRNSMINKLDVSGNFKFVEIPVEVKIEKIETENISTQTDPVDISENSNMNYLYCGREGNDVSTQTEIYIRQPQSKKIIIPEKYLRTTKDTCCGSIEPYRPGFKGFIDIETDALMRQLTGITRQFFSILLKLIDDRKGSGQLQFYRTLRKEDRLLLFLMKLKLGIAFGALGCLFHVHATTASRIFHSLLEILADKTQTWIFWPSKESLKAVLPKSCSQYSKYRCSISCMEIPMDSPPKMEQREMTYSNRERKFTQKILIATAPNGYIYKYSKAYGGRTDDAFIVNDSKLLEGLEPGDEVSVAEDFPQIRDELLQKNIILTAEGKRGCNAASVRLLSERSFQRIKIFHILDHMPIDLVPHIDAIMHMCCVIANSQSPPTEEQ